MMMHRGIVWIVGMCFLTGCTSTLAAKRAVPPEVDNAALLYYQAMLLATTNAAVACDPSNVTESSQRLIAAHADALDMIERGVRLPVCDWGKPRAIWEPQSIGIGAARNLVNVVLVRARMNFTEGKHAEGMDDCLLAMAFGRHLSRAGSKISVFYHYDIEMQATQLLATQLSVLTQDELARLRHGLDSLPEATFMGDALASDADAFVQKLLAMIHRGEPERVIAIFDSIMGGYGPDESEAARRDPDAKDVPHELTAWAQMRPYYAGDDVVDRLRASLEEIGRICDEQVKLFRLSYDTFEPANNAFDAQVRAPASPLARALTDGLPWWRKFTDRAEVHALILRAAIAYRIEGRRGFEKFIDPASRTPFLLTGQEDGGFRIESTLRDPLGAPVSLEVPGTISRPAGE